MIKKSDDGAGYTISCDLCGISVNNLRTDFREIIKSITRLGWDIRQEVTRTGSGYRLLGWKNYCPDCKHIEGILIN